MVFPWLLTLFMFAILMHLKMSCKAWFEISRYRFYWPQYSSAGDECDDRMVNQLSQLVGAAFHLRMVDAISKRAITGAGTFFYNKTSHYATLFISQGTAVLDVQQVLNSGDLAYYFLQPGQSFQTTPGTKAWLIEWQVPDYAVLSFDQKPRPWQKKRMLKYRRRQLQKSEPTKINHVA